jgi:hypothetical protein
MNKKDTFDAAFHQLMSEIEQTAQSKIKGFDIIGERENGLVFYAIFENEKEMAGHFTVQTFGKRMALRVQANFI